MHFVEDLSILRHQTVESCVYFVVFFILPSYLIVHSTTRLQSIDIYSFKAILPSFFLRLNVDPSVTSTLSRNLPLTLFISSPVFLFVSFSVYIFLSIFFLHTLFNLVYLSFLSLSLSVYPPSPSDVLLFLLCFVSLE